MRDEAGGRRVVIEGVEPEVDGGRFPVKRVVGETVEVEADAFTDGHDAIVCRLPWRPESQPKWSEVPMAALPNDRWRGGFTVTEQGRRLYTVVGWVDPFKTWRRDLRKRVEAGQEGTLHLRGAAALIREASERGRVRRRRADARVLAGLADDLEVSGSRRSASPWRSRRSSPSSWTAMPTAGTPPSIPASSAWWWTGQGPLQRLVRDVPALQRPASGKHGTFRDCEARLPYVAGMGFDVLYLPPIHPIGTAFRKGPNNALERRTRRRREPVGDRRARRAATRPSTPSSARSTTSSAWSTKARRARHRDRARHRLPVLARPSLRARAPGVVPQPAGRHDPVRREPAQEVPGHLSVRLRDARPGGRCGRSCRASSSSGSSRACASSASTTRTPSRSPSGSG